MSKAIKYLVISAALFNVAWNVEARLSSKQEQLGSCFKDVEGNDACQSKRFTKLRRLGRFLKDHRTLVMTGLAAGLGYSTYRLQQRAGNLMNRNNAIEGEINRVRRDYEELLRQHNTIEQQLSNSRNEHTQLSRHQTTVVQEANRLRRELDIWQASGAEMSQLAERADRCEKDKIALQRQMQELNVQLADCQKMLGQKVQEMSALEAAKQVLEQQLSESQRIPCTRTAPQFRQLGLPAQQEDLLQFAPERDLSGAVGDALLPPLPESPKAQAPAAFQRDEAAQAEVGEAAQEEAGDAVQADIPAVVADQLIVGDNN